MTDLPASIVTIAIFLVTQLGIAIVYATNLAARVRSLEQTVQTYAKFDARLVRIETLLEQLIKQEEAQVRR